MAIHTRAVYGGYPQTRIIIKTLHRHDETPIDGKLESVVSPSAYARSLCRCTLKHDGSFEHVKQKAKEF